LAWNGWALIRQNSFVALWRICSVRRSIPRRALLTLIQALVVSKIHYSNSVLAGVSDALQRRLQSVLNAAARLVFSVGKSEHITPLLRELHWLRVPERIKFRLCVLAFRCLHHIVPRYLAETLHLTTSRSSCSRLWSVAMSTLIVWATRQRTLGDHAFPVAAARAWNSLPSFVRDKQSPAGFRQQLKTVLFWTSFSKDAYSWAASLLTGDSFVFVRWPCNVLNVITPP